MIWAITNANRTASPNPVSCNGPTSYERGWWTIEAKIVCMSVNLGGDKARDRAAGVGVEVETGSLTLLESVECGAGDHGGVVGGEARTRCEDCVTLGLESRSHRCGERSIAGDTSAEDDSLPGKSICGAPGFLDQSIDQRILECSRDVCFIGFDVLRPAHRVEHGRLDAAEREGVVVVVLRQCVLSHHWARKMEALWISLACELLDVAPARIRKSKKLRDLVERFAGRVVASRAEQPVFPPRLYIEKQRVAARDQQCCERRDSVAMLERCREKVSFHVMNSEQRDAARKRERLAIADSHEQCADQPRRICYGDGAEIIELDSRLFDRALDHWNDAGEMRARCDLRNDSAEHAVDVLGQNHERFLRDLITLTLENRSGCLVAGGFDSQNPRHDYSVRSVSSLSTRARASGEFQSVADISFFLI